MYVAALFVGALAEVINIQLILDGIGDLAGHRAALGVCHGLHKGLDEGNVLHGLLRAHHRIGVVAVVDGGGVGRGKAGEGEGGHTLVGEGGGVAGVDILIGFDAEALHGGKVGDVVGQLFLGGNAGQELTHDGADHIEVHIENDFAKVLFVGGHIGLGTQQTPFLGAAPDEPQTEAVGNFGKMLRHRQKTDTAGHIVIGADGEGGGIVMGGQHDGLLHLAGQIENHIAGGAFGFLLVDGDLHGLHTAFDQRDGLLGVDVDTGDARAAVNIGAQLPLVDVLVRIVGIAVKGDEAEGAVIQNIVIEPVFQITLAEDDLAAALLQRPRIGIAEVIERGFYLTAAGTVVALAGDGAAVCQQFRLAKIECIHFECLNFSVKTYLCAAGGEIFGAAKLFGAAAGADIGGVLQNLGDFGRFHNISSLSVIFSIIA